MYYDGKSGCIFWTFTDDSSYIEPVYDGDTLAYWNVWQVPEFGGETNLDSHCNSLKEAMEQLEMVSM